MLKTLLTFSFLLIAVPSMSLTCKDEIVEYFFWNIPQTWPEFAYTKKLT